MGLAQLQSLPDPAPTPGGIHVLPPAQVAAPVAAAPAARGGLNLGALAAAKPAKAKADTHPIVEGTAELQALATKFAAEQPAFKALEGSVKSTRVAIVNLAFPLWLQAAGGKPDLSSVHVFGTPVESGTRAKILFGVQNRYPSTIDFATGQEAILQAIARPGDSPEQVLARFEEHFEASLAISLNFSKVPEAQRQSLVDALLPIFQEHDLLTIPEGTGGGDEDGDEAEASPAVVCRQVLAPKPGFHVRRHTAFSFAENVRLQAVLPAVGMVKVTGLKGGTR